MEFSTPAGSCMERTISVSEKNQQISRKSFDEIYDIKRTLDWIQDNNFERVCLQFPDSQLADSVALLRKLKSASNKEIFILADTSFNSCCVDEVAARHINSDCIIHYGHSCLAPTDFPVFHVYNKSESDIHATVQSLKQIDSEDLLILYDVSLEHLRESLCQKIFEALPHVKIGVLPKSSNSRDPTVFGRNIIDKNGTSIDINSLPGSHLCFIGNAGPTLFNIAVCSKDYQLHHCDPVSGEASLYSESQWFKRRRFLIEKCRDASSVGILVCTLSVRNYAGIVRRVKKVVRASGKKCYTLTVGKPNIAKLANLSEIQIFVLVACPENELYSCKDFLSPIIYPYELEVALNQNRNQFDTNYSTDFNELLPEGRNYREVSENGSHQPDVSLITGMLRNFTAEERNVGDAASVANVRKEDWAVVELGIGSSISNRSWKGLEQDLGQTKVELAVEGRKGIASGYEGELF